MSNIPQFLAEHAPTEILAPICVGLFTIVWFFVKKTLQIITEDLKIAMGKLTTIEETTRIQAENHLRTIQDETIKQTALLVTLTKEQAETNGYLRAVVDVSKQSKS